jgi:hypothetical protein
MASLDQPPPAAPIAKKVKYSTVNENRYENKI